jgi:hypothetical protein
MLDEALGGGSGGSEREKTKSFGQPSDIIGDPTTFLNGFPVPGQITGGLSPASAYGTPGSYYVSSDIYLPLTLSPDQIFQLQKALAQSGWFRSSSIDTAREIPHPGQWDTDSQMAFRDLLEYANQAGLDWHDALGKSLDAQQAGSGFGGGSGGGSGSGGSGAATAPLTISLPNERDVRQQVEELTRNVTDVDLGDDFYRHATDLWMDTLRTAQLRDWEARDRQTRAAMAGDGSAAPITTTEPQSLETFSQDLLEKEHPNAVRNADIGDAEQTFMEAMTRSYG